jgi:tetratricopeptide (TPR) repeat protein
VTRVLALAALIACAASAPAPAQQRPQSDPLAQGLDLERRGNFVEAIGAYRAALAARPGDPSALLGLERSLQPLNRTAEVLVPARAALAAAPTAAVYGVLVRAFTAEGSPDSARSAVERWAKAAPRDDAPYREWGMAAMQARDRATAKAAFELARARLRRRDVLAAEMAQILVAEGQWDAAAGEWLLAARQLPGYLLTGLAALTPAPDRVRAGVIELLARDTTLLARRLQAPLMARWGDPLDGADQLIAALPDSPQQASEALTQFAEQLRPMGTPGAAQARGRALEELARRSVGLAASRARLESARAYQEAGDRDGARRMLGNVASDTTSGAASAGAATTLIGVLVDDGRIDDAERRLESARPGLPADEFQALNRRVAAGWIRRGDLNRAGRLLQADSTVEGMALSGRIAIFRGDIAGGVTRLRMAGPYAGTREEATERTALLALLQPIESDSLPALGAALLLLERRDSAGAAASMERVAGGLPPDHGGAELRYFAGTIYHGLARRDHAERLYRAAATEAAPTTAPAAELALGRLLIELRRGAESIPILEHLILTYPTSALVPQARRALDEARGAIPRT